VLRSHEPGWIIAVALECNQLKNQEIECSSVKGRDLHQSLRNAEYVAVEREVNKRLKWAEILLQGQSGLIQEQFSSSRIFYCDKSHGR
jgi:hypothetical protein